MIAIRVKNTEAELVENWSELTLKQGIELHRVAHQLPDTVKEMYRLMFEGFEEDSESMEKVKTLQAKITERQRVRELPQLYGDFIRILTTLDEEVIEKLTPLARTSFYNKHLLRFVIGILFFPVDFEPSNPDSFEIKGIKYYLPKSRTLYIGSEEVEEPFFEGTALEFTETADLELAAKELEGGRFEMAANIIAILCRPKGEPYNEQVSLIRVPTFKKHLQMDTVWEVFFCIIESFNIARTFTPTYLRRVKGVIKAMQATWCATVGMLKFKT